MTPRTWLLAALPALLLATACGKDDDVNGGSGPNGSMDGGANGKGDGGNGEGGSGGPDGGLGCVGLQCQIRDDCPAGSTTSISGKVFDPAGNNPLYNVVVYVPNAPLAPLPQGASCDSCASLFSGSPITVAQTDATGSFMLDNVPVGSDIPLVIQVGKWRRQLSVASVAACQDNPQPDGSLRLPRNSSEGDIPNIAISTGEADTLECLLRRVGIDASEYTPGAAGPGRIHIFRGTDRGTSLAPDTSPPAPRSPTALWNSAESLMAYDILLLSCEGRETQRMNQQALHDYASAGGRVFASHFHYSWFNTGPYADENLATWRTGSQAIGNIRGDIVTTLPDGAPFPKGQALNTWLSTVGALENGKLPIEEARNNATINASHTPSQAWILVENGASGAGGAQYFSFNTPTDVIPTPDQEVMQCGRVVYSDLHVGAASGDDQDDPVPQGCSSGELSPQEKALEFMLFDLSSCVTPDNRLPEPPPVVVLE